MYIKGIGSSRFKYRSLILFTGRKIYANHSPTDDYEQVAGQNAMKLLRMTVVILFVVIVSFSLVLIGPIYAFVVHGEYNSIGGGIVPFTDLETLDGFILNVIFQTGMGLLGFVASVAIEISNCVIINAITVMSDLACCSMQQFSAGLVAGTFTVQNKAQLRDIFVRLQDLENYVNLFNDVYYWKFFLQPFTTTPCVSLAIFGQLKVCDHKI